MDRAARNDGPVAAWASGRGEAGGPGRSRSSRTADSTQLCRQEHPDRPRRSRTSAAGRARCRRAQSGRPRRVVLDGRIAQGGGAPGMRPLLLTGGRVIDPQHQLDAACDVLVIDGEIDALEPAGSLQAPEGAEVVDCAGLWIVPGLIDPHVHLRDPGFPEKETILTGLRAAAAGGFTTVAAMANTSPVDDTPAIARYML